MKCGRFQRFYTYREGYRSFYNMFIVRENFQSFRCKATLIISSVYCPKCTHSFKTLVCHTEIKQSQTDIGLEFYHF